ncbi:MAG: hypothetical protein IT383_26545 [Deltaproteobacteria bacterium]|nr:hypothetical protein [Deltaproteobacteria bacterium]
MQKLLLCCSLAMVASGAAFAQGEGEGEGEACGTVDELGECDGTDAIWCDTASNTLARVECGDLLGDGTVAGGCEVFAGFGSWCAMPDGTACAFSSQSGQAITMGCATDSSGCIDGVCTAGAGACAPDTGETGTQTCLAGNILQLACGATSQVIGYTCAGISAASTCSGDVCTGVASGDPCADGVAECGSGLTCGSEDTCVAEGEGEGEEGEGEGDGECASDRDCDDGEVCEDGECVGGSEQAPLCNHSAASAGVPAAGLLALGGLLIGIRRRRA